MDILSSNPSYGNPPFKHCGGCDRTLAATSEIFYLDRSKKDGFSTRCKACQRAYYESHSGRDKKRRHDSNEVPEGMKVCVKCNQTLPATTENFQRSKSRKDGWYPYCKTCQSKWRNTPVEREKKIAYNRNYYGTLENRERILAQRKENYHSDPEVREQALTYNKLPEVRDYQRSYLKEYNKTPVAQAKRKVSKHARRSREKLVAGTHTSQQIQDLLKRQKHKCYYCGTKFEKKNGKYVYNVEHTFPISRVAGTDIPANDISYIVLACYPCNRDKGDKFPWEFPQGGRLL